MSPVRAPYPLSACLLLTGLFSAAGCEQTTVSVLEVATVEISPSALTIFEGDRETVTAILRERGGGQLGGRPVTWRSDDPDIAEVDEGGVVEGRSAGTTRVHAEAEGVTGTADVAVLVPPAIAVSTTSQTLQGVAGNPGPSEAQIAIANSGEGTLGGLGVTIRSTGGGAAPWLQAELSSNTAPATLTLRASAGQLSSGVYDAVVELTSPDARNSPVEVAVRFEVAQPPPEIRVVPTSVSFSAVSGAHQPATVTVDIENAGGGTLSPINVGIRYLGSATGWLEAELERSTAPTDLVIRASSRFLLAGLYRAVVEVSSPAADNTVEVQVTFIIE